MSALTPLLAVYLLATLAPAIVRLVRGPSMGDRVLATTLIGTTGVAILALVAWDGGRPGALDAALVVCLLAAAPVIVYATRMTERS